MAIFVSLLESKPQQNASTTHPCACGWVVEPVAWGPERPAHLSPSLDWDDRIVFWRSQGPERAGGSRGRACARLTKADRLSMERGLDRNESCRAMAREPGGSPPTAHDEVERPAAARMALIRDCTARGLSPGVFVNVVIAGLST